MAPKKSSSKSVSQKMTKKASKNASNDPTIKLVKKSAKKAAKKSHNASAVSAASAKDSQKKSQKTPKRTPQKQSILPFVLLALGVVVIVIGAVMLLKPAPAAPQSEVAAVVNGQEISTRQLNTQYAILPEQYKAVYTEQMILEQLIDEELLIQYAKEQGITVTPEEVNEEIQQILVNGALSITELQENLETFNLTQEDFEMLMERKIYIERGMNLLLEDLEKRSDDAIAAYYEENKEAYFVPEQVTVRHILVASQRDNAAQFGKDLIDDIKGGADFCELVVAESDDKGSVDACGEYTFPRGFMVPEFEKASFEMSPGDLTMVQTAFGYHIIEKLADVPAGTTPLEEVEADIASTLNRDAELAEYQAFLEAEKLSGDIQILYE